jgi:hypothetical protein
MPTEVELPDGTIAEFPDGMALDAIKQALRKRFASAGGAMRDAPPAPGAVAGRFANPGMAGTSPVDTATDVMKSAGSGLVKGGMALATLPGNVEALGRAGINKAVQMYRGNEENVVNPETVLTNYGDLKPRVEKHTGQLYEPQTTAGKYAGTIAEFAPGMAFGGGGIAARALGNVVAPAVASETAGQLTEGTAAEPWARAAGALVGPRALTPAPIRDPERAKMVQTLRNEGVTALTAGQTTGRAPLRWTESALADAPFVGKAQKINEKAGDQYTRAVLKRAGVDADRATPEVLDQAFTRLGQQFEAAGQNAAVPISRNFVQDLQNIAGRYNRIAQPQFRSGIPQGIADDVAALSGNATRYMDGAKYLQWRSEIGEAARGASDPATKRVLYDLQRKLDDGAEQFLRATGKGDVADTFKQARKEYRNLLIIEKAASGAGERSALGVISPSQFRNAVKTESIRDYSRGRTDMAELARAGEAIMKPLPQSGTAPRAAVSSGLAAIGGTLAGAPGALVSIVAPTAAGHILMSGPMQRALANQLAPNRTSRNPGAMAPVLADDSELGLFGTVRR